MTNTAETAPSGTPPRAPVNITAFGPELALLTVVGLWASTFVVTKAAFDEISALAFTFVRFALMAVLAFGVMLTQRGVPRTARRVDLPHFVAAGIAGYTLYQLGFVLGLERTSPFSSSLLIAMVPLFTLVIIALRGESPEPRAWVGVAVAIAGAVVFLLDKRGEGSGGTLAGDALSLGAAVCFATYGVVNRPLVAAYPPATYTAYTLLIGTIPLLAVSTPAAIAQDWGAISAWGWLAIGYMVILPVYVAYMLWNWGIARRGVAAATGFSLLVPVVSGTLSALFFAEGFGLVKVLGAALVLAGLGIMRTRRGWPFSRPQEGAR